jgi:hypothetical protein
MKNKSFLLLSFLLLFCYSCKKDNRVLGVDVQPTEDDLNANVTKGIVYAHTQKIDSTLILKNTKLKYIGSNNDKYFGRLDVGLYLNSNISVTSLNFGTTPVLNSAEIILAVDILNYTGNLNSTLTYSVFSLDSALRTTGLYFTSNNRLHNKDSLIAVHNTSLTVYKGKLAIRIPIDSNYADRIIQHPEHLVNNTTFQAQYKGFYVSPSVKNSEEGAIYLANLEDSISGFYINYKPTPSDSLKSFRFSFSGSKAARFNTVTYTVTEAHPSLKAQISGDTAKGADNLFLRGLGVTRLKVFIPFLKNRSDSGIWAVNRAEVVFHVDPSFTDASGKYQKPPALTLFALDSLGREVLTQDQKNSTDQARYDGTYDEAGKKYVFNIARHAQSILKGERRNYGFHLHVVGSDLDMIKQIERLVLAGSKNATLHPEFNLSYVILKND